MRYEKGHKELTRERIVKIASRRFRKDGIDSVGLASLMSEAGLTHGGFYNHFKSKEDLVATALGSALQESYKKQDRRTSEENYAGLEKFVRAYLHPDHRDHPDKGCAIAATAAEIARHPEATRQVVAERIERLYSLIERHLPSSLTAAQKRKTAMAVFSVMVGALQLARITTGPEASEQILQSGIAAALTLAAAADKEEHIGQVGFSGGGGGRQNG